MPCPTALRTTCRSGSNALSWTARSRPGLLADHGDLDLPALDPRRVVGHPGQALEEAADRPRSGSPGARPRAGASAGPGRRRGRPGDRPPAGPSRPAPPGRRPARPAGGAGRHVGAGRSPGADRSPAGRAPASCSRSRQASIRLAAGPGQRRDRLHATPPAPSRAAAWRSARRPGPSARRAATPRSARARRPGPMPAVGLPPRAAIGGSRLRGGCRAGGVAGSTARAVAGPRAGRADRRGRRASRRGCRSARAGLRPVASGAAPPGRARGRPGRPVPRCRRPP